MAKRDSSLSPSVFRALMVADIHMSNRLPYAKPTQNGMTDRLEDQLRLWDEMKRCADASNVDAVFVLGDLFDKALIDAVTLTHTVEAVTALDQPVYILPGNHDANSVRGGRFTVEAFGRMRRDNIRVFKTGEPFEFDTWLRFWPVEYMPVEDTRERLAEIRARLDPDQHNVLLMHNSILGCTHLQWTCDDGLEADEVTEGFDQVYSGHFHDRQRFGADAQGLYLGAPMHHHYGDVGREAGYWLIEFNQGGAEGQYIEPKMPRFYKATGMGNKFEPATVAGYVKSNKIEAGDYLRLEVACTNADWATLKPKVKAICDALQSTGIKASAKHKPIYHHKVRLEGDTDSKQMATAPTLDAAIARYVDAAGVVTGDLDVGELKRIGRETLAAARGG